MTVSHIFECSINYLSVVVHKESIYIGCEAKTMSGKVHATLLIKCC